MNALRRPFQWTDCLSPTRARQFLDLSPPYPTVAQLPDTSRFYEMFTYMFQLLHHDALTASCLGFSWKYFTERLLITKNNVFSRKWKERTLCQMSLAGNMGAPGGMFRTNLKVCVDKRKVYMGRHAKRLTSVRHYAVFLSFLQLHRTMPLQSYCHSGGQRSSPYRQPHKYGPHFHIPFLRHLF